MSLPDHLLDEPDRPERGHDCLLDMLDAERRRLAAVPVYDADDRERCFAALGQLIAALPTERQRWAGVILIANDLACRFFMPLDMAAGLIQGYVWEAERDAAR